MTKISRRTTLAAIGSVFLGAQLAHASPKTKRKVNVTNTSKIFTIAIIENPASALVSGGPISVAEFTREGGIFLHPGETVTIETTSGGLSDHVYAYCFSGGTIIVSTGNSIAISVPRQGATLSVDFSTTTRKTTLTGL